MFKKLLLRSLARLSEELHLPCLVSSKAPSALGAPCPGHGARDKRGLGCVALAWCSALWSSMVFLLSPSWAMAYGRLLRSAAALRGAPSARDSCSELGGRES